ncbi:MAG TPA: PH domain-containing protein [Polyangiaceae bacterium]|nr:PH domain-containing protein [Polyangiaceae bacterium]
MPSTFQIVPATGTWVLGVMVAACFALLGFVAIRVGSAMVGSQRASFEVSDAGLRLRGDFYGRVIPRAKLVGHGIRIVDLERESGLRPVRRLLGTGLPGYRAGWFRLANGEKALLYVTDESNVVYVPTTENYCVLVSATDPQRFAEQLRQIAQ